jgi:hypothetical protein
VKKETTSSLCLRRKRQRPFFFSSPFAAKKASLELTIGEQNASFKLGVDESSNGFSLELANDEITPNIDWEFQSRSGGLDCLKIYIH